MPKEMPDKVVCVPAEDTINGDADIWACTEYKGDRKLRTIRSKEIPAGVNDKLIDIWALLHVVVGMIVGIVAVILFPTTSLIVTAGVVTIVGWEVLEHFILSEGIFKWKEAGQTETAKNTLIDIVAGLLGFMLSVLAHMIF